MKTKTLSLSTVLGFLGLLLMIHTFNSYASSPTIVCNSAFGEKSLTIDEQSVSFQKEDEMGVNRSISSSNDQAVSTYKKSNGFTKTLYINGNRHRIHD